MRGYILLREKIKTSWITTELIQGERIMLSTQHAVISNKRKRELKDYSLNKLYIALKIIIISSTIGMQNAYAVDLPSADAGCDTGTVTCTVTSALGRILR